jgi:hypothetical protein
VRSASREAGAIFAAGETTARGRVHGRRRPANEQSQRRVERPLVRTLVQRLGVDGAEHRTAGRIDHGDDDLQTAGDVEHDPIKRGSGTGDAHQVTYRNGFHSPSLPSAGPRASTVE